MLILPPHILICISSTAYLTCNVLVQTCNGHLDIDDSLKLIEFQSEYLPVEYCFDEWSCCSLINIFIITTFIKSFIKHKLILKQTIITTVTIVTLIMSNMANKDSNVV